jgi:beta-N-acetylhexosaminidase
MLNARDPRVTGTRLAPNAPADSLVPTGDADHALSDALAAATGKPLVVVVRDAHRVPTTRQRLGTVLATRPDAVVVGIGTGADRPLAAGRYLGTRGGARVNLSAAADLLVGARR